MELTYSGFEKHDDTGILLLDIAKAFDKIWHDGLCVGSSIVILVVPSISDDIERGISVEVLGGLSGLRIHPGVPWPFR
ncbi:hypothetical protein TNCV_2209271 [Trichonephila clavipes]|nr:hypothetical protein TNCV_2209271 [Trichonephila clavipes]